MNNQNQDYSGCNPIKCALAYEYNRVDCPLSDSKLSFESESSPSTDTQKNLLKKIQEVGFALTDLNLYLDVHPECTQALELFKNLASSLKSMKSDYANKYGPLYAVDSESVEEFEWVKDGYRWPWQI